MGIAAVSTWTHLISRGKGSLASPFLKMQIKLRSRLLCKLWVRSPLSWQSSKSRSWVWPEPGPFPNTPASAFEAQDFLVREERGNLHLSLEKVPMTVSIPAPATPELPGCRWNLHENVKERMKSLVTSDCPAGAAHGSERNFLFPRGSWSSYTPVRRGTKTFFSRIPRDAECLVCALPSWEAILIFPNSTKLPWKEVKT